MTRQYFQVGEEVTLESAIRPEHNGDYVVLGCMTNAEYAQHLATQNSLMSDSVLDVPFFYQLENFSYFLPNENGLGGGASSFVQQPSLRKKHTPGEDFQSLISSLNKDKVAS